MEKVGVGTGKRAPDSKSYCVKNWNQLGHLHKVYRIYAIYSTRIFTNVYRDPTLNSHWHHPSLNMIVLTKVCSTIITSPWMVKTNTTHLDWYTILMKGRMKRRRKILCWRSEVYCKNVIGFGMMPVCLQGKQYMASLKVIPLGLAISSHIINSCFVQ